MRLGLVAVALLAACGPMPEDTAQASSTLPVRVARWSPDGDDLYVPVDLLDLRMRVWGDGELLGDFHYRGTFEFHEPFADLGEIRRTPATSWRFAIEYSDSTGAHALDQEAQLIGNPKFSSIVVCVVEGTSVSTQVVMIDRSATPPAGASLVRSPVQGSLPRYTLTGARDDETGPQLRQAGFGRVHDTFDVLRDGARSHMYLHGYLEHQEAAPELVPGVYQFSMLVPQSRWIAPHVLQLDQFVLGDTFAIER
ncbi:MAG: hypothetical protein QM723_24305 [Myxococcaceae bacterium]